jgi:hypothetical protein
MHTETVTQPDSPYRRIVAASKKARFDLDRDVFRGRTLEPDLKYLPDGLSRIDTKVPLTETQRAFISRIQGRTYANIFGLVERYINAKVLEISSQHALGDQVELEALMRFSEEELKHQEMFRRLEAAAARVMPEGYVVAADPDDVARAVLGKSTWAVLALTCHIELFTLVHYRQSIDGDPRLSPLFKDVFLHHFKEESQHAVLDELEWRREDRRLTEEQRGSAVNELIDLVVAVDAILSAQAHADCHYFVKWAGRSFDAQERLQLEAMFLSAYRYQYIVSGLQQTRFVEILTGLLSPAQLERVQAALVPLLSA